MIYFIQKGHSGPIKIGFTAKKSVDHRLAAINTSSDEKCFLIGLLDGDYHLEQALHLAFSHVRLNGEWFAPVEQLCMFIDRISPGEKENKSDECVSAAFYPDKNCQYFDLKPASTIIALFGGRDEIVKITGVDRTRVYRWTQPKSRGGTDGLIPFGHVAALLKAAHQRKINLSADDFLPINEDAA